MIKGGLDQVLVAKDEMYRILLNDPIVGDKILKISLMEELSDAINSPDRPLSQRKISMREAKTYVSISFTLPQLYLFFIHTDIKEKLIVWTI